MQPRRTTILPPLLWSVGALGALAALTRVGRGDPRFDVPTDPAAWPQWWSGLDPLDAAAAIGRWVALVLLGYLAVVALLHLVAAVAPRGRVRKVAKAATPRFLTGLLAGAVVVAGSSTVGATAPDHPTTTSPSGSNPPVMRVIEVTAANDTSSPPTTTAPPAPTTTTVAPAAAPETPLPYFTSPQAVPPALDEEPSVTAPPTSPTAMVEMVVAPGDHLWAIAERTVAERLDADPTVAEVADYWRRLIDANHDRLVDPSLIHPGLRLVLPS